MPGQQCWLQVQARVVRTWPALSGSVLCGVPKAHGQRSHSISAVDGSVYGEHLFYSELDGDLGGGVAPQL